MAVSITQSPVAPRRGEVRGIRSLLHTLLLLVACIAAFPAAAQTPAISVRSGSADGNPFAWTIVPFTVVNNTGAAQTTWLSTTCDNTIWAQWDFEDDPADYGECGADNVYLPLAPHESRTISVAIWTGAMRAAGNVTLTAATATAAFSGTMTLFVPRRPRLADISITPHNSTITVTPNSLYLMRFTLKNASTAYPVWAEFALDCSVFITSSCAWFKGNTILFDNHGWYLYGIDVAPDSIAAKFSFNTGPPGTRGTIKVMNRLADPATGIMAYDTASFTVLSGDQLMPSVLPKGSTRTAAPRVARADTFTVTNTGLVSASYAFTPDCGTFAASGGGCSAAPASAQLAAGAAVKVAVTYLPTAVSGSQTTIKLVASGTIPGVAAQIDSGSMIVTAVDASPPVIAVTPAAGAVLSSQRFTATVNVCDDGVLSNPIVRFNGDVLPDMFLRAPKSGCGSAGSSVFSLAAVPGLNTLQVIESDGYNTDTLTRTFTYDDAAESAPKVTAVFDPTAISLLRIPLATAWADSFTVANTGPVPATYSLTAVCSTFVGCTAPTTITVPRGSSLTVAISYLSPSVAGQYSTVQLIASHTSTTGHTVSGSAQVAAMTAAGARPTISVSPASGATFSTPTIALNITWCDSDDGIASRQVRVGNLLLPDTFVSSPGPGCASGGTSSWPAVALQPWDQTIAAIATDAAGHVTRAANTVRFIPPLAAFMSQVTPKNTTRMVTRNVVSSQLFWITNAGSYPATYRLTPSCGTYSVCVGDKASVTLAPGARDSTRVSFLAPALIATYAPIRVVAQYVGQDGSSIADSADVVVHTPTAAELFQPKVIGTYDLGVVSASAIVGLTYTVQNLGAEDANYWVVGQTTGGMSFTTPPPMRLFVPAGGVVSVGAAAAVPATAGTVASASLVVFYTASDNTVVQSTGTFMVRSGGAAAPAPTAAVSVSPHALSPATPANTDIVQHFDISSIGTTGARFVYSVACSGGAACQARTDSTALLTPGGSESVTVLYHTGPLGAQGRVVIIAAPGTAPAASDSGVLSFSVSTVAPIVVSVANLNPGPSVSRDQCLTIAAGRDAAYECGDLRLAHGLPPTRTMNRTRAPTLVYNSAHARGRGVIAASLAVLPGSAPGILRASLSFGPGKVFTQDIPWNSAWSDGSPRRIAVLFDALDRTLTTSDQPIGLFKYTLEVRSVSDATMVGEDSGTVVVINRAASPFGQGWWLDGLEQLSLVTPVPSQRLWVGGDGSTRVYTQVSDSLWIVSPTMDRPDSLTRSGTTYRRHLPNGAYVEFDAFGRHIATVNAARHRTDFVYQLNGLLSRIDLPVPAGSLADHSYIFNYDDLGRLVTIDAPAAAAGRRRVVITPAGGSGRVVASMTDPGLPAVSFGVDASGVITDRQNRLNQTTHFGFDPSSHLLVSATVGLVPDDGPSLISTFCPAEGTGLSACASTPVLPALAHTHYTGPRYDRRDTTNFYLTQYGAPQRIAGALGNTTTIERNDAHWPLLATAVVDAAGHRVETTYDPARALTLSVTDVNRFATSPGGASVRTTTTYAWDATCDEVTLVIGPSGETQAFSYNHPSCTRYSQADGRGTSTMATFGYDSMNRLRDIVRPMTQRAGATEHYEYDSKLGNDSLSRSPLGIVTITVRDAAGMDSVTVAPIDSLGAVVTTSVERDAAGREAFTRVSGREVYRSGSNRPDYFHFATVDTVVTHKWFNAESDLDSLTRHISPSINGILDLTTRWAYDGAGRKRSETSADGNKERYTYDDGVNLKSLTTRNGDVVSMVYDALNRLVSKHLPARSVSRSLNTLAVPAQVDSFTYDVAGRMIRASNPFAIVTREYAVGGLLTKETQQLASASGAFGQHTYDIRVEYDSSGRRQRLYYPTGLSADNVLTYRYNAFGGVASIGVGSFGGAFTFDYDARQRLTTVVDPSGVADIRQYDDDDRLTAAIQRAPQANLGWFPDSRDQQDTIRADHIVRDLAGRAVRVAGYDFDSYDMGYNAVGPLAYSWHHNSNFQFLSRNVEETFAVDALGNVQQTASSNVVWSGVDVHTYDPGTGRLTAMGPPPGATAPAPSLAAEYDPAGNQVWVVRSRAIRALLYPTVPIWLVTNTMNAYDAAGHLRVVRQRPAPSQVLHALPEDEFADEETRYDALGRRVWVQSRHVDGSVGPCGISCSVQRFVWDGDQLLGEFRMPVDPSTAENDTQTISTWKVLPGDGGGPPLIGADSIRTYSWTWGAVSYVHGLGMDQPIAVIRQGGGPVGDTLPISPVTFYPHVDWRGNMTSASFAGGRPLLFGNVHATPPLQLEQNVALSAYASSISPTWAVTTWSGSLINGQFGETGLQYRRNRYYDPQQGRFTQEDPIGLAGGMNLYGFAGGDPVNFADPFGLCPAVLLFAGPVAGGVTAAWCGAEVVALSASAALVWLSKSRTSGENPAASGGREAHKSWNPGEGFQKEVRLPSGKRCDALNPESCEIKELKPDNDRAKKRGEKQLSDYKKELDERTGNEHKTTLETYKPKQP